MGNRKLDGATALKIMAFEWMLGQEDRRPHILVLNLSSDRCSRLLFLAVFETFTSPPIFPPSNAERSLDLCWATQSRPGKNSQCTDERSRGIHQMHRSD